MSFQYNHPSSGLTLVPDGPGGLLTAWSADLVSDMRVSFPGLVTEHPVTDGEPLTDHVVLLPPVLQIDCMVTDHPARFIGLVAPERAIGLANDLLELRNNRTVLSVSTSRGVFPGYILETLDERRGVDTGSAIELSLTFKRRRVAVTSVSVAALDNDSALAGVGGSQVVSV